MLTERLTTINSSLLSVEFIMLIKRNAITLYKGYPTKYES